MNGIMYQSDNKGIDWNQVKESYSRSAWDTGRSAVMLNDVFEASYCVSFALAENLVIGTARAISDGLDSAALFDVWVDPAFRKRGIGQNLVKMILSRLPGQYVLLSTEVAGFYRKMGFAETGAMYLKMI